MHSIFSMCGYYSSSWLLNVGVLLVFGALLFVGVVLVLRRFGPKDTHRG
ncbi:MAG: hypothetical protein JSU73_12640 [candidate division WOR-3 bacterium]|nr:MAG: hypothetical protein JSU73_12640 [candidate division WOR-3 bacterium]